MKIRFSFDGFCRTHRTYLPERDGKPGRVNKNRDCYVCDRLYAAWLYTKIARRAADDIHHPAPVQFEEQSKS